MVDREKITFEIVRVLESHARLVMEWRNDPLTLEMSYNQQPKVWGAFWDEFRADYFSILELPPLFVNYEGLRVAFLRFRSVDDPVNPKRRCCEVSINVAPKSRGQGFGKLALTEVQQWIRQQGYGSAYAEVKEANAISHKLFIQSGFDDIGAGIKSLPDIGVGCPIQRYLVVLNDDQLQKDEVLIIAEAGSNWRVGSPRRDYAMARSLINVAAEAGANVIKFQTYRPESIYVHNAGQSDYLADAGIMEDISTIFADHAMPYEMIHDLAAYCKECSIEFMSTPFSEKDFEVVDPYVIRHKIASYEISHIKLIELAAKSGKPTIISTGAATEDEISWAAKTFYEFAGKDLTLLQCTAKYPADPYSMNLRVIPWLQQRFNVPAGLSDHSRDPIAAPIAAVALGATIIEKHFSLSNSLPGPDHYFAVLPHELKEMVREIRLVEQMRGSGVKSIQEVEEELRDFARRGIQAMHDIHEGDVLKEGRNVAILRPGNQHLGVHPKFLKSIEGKKAKRHILAGTGIKHGDWE